MSRIDKLNWAMQLAQVTSQLSTCCRRQVGCVLLDEQWRVLSTGFNGVARGELHCNEPRFWLPGPGAPMETRYPHACEAAESASGTNLDGCLAIHAEQNAMLQCRDVDSVHRCVVTASPCMTCTKLLMNTGCQHIVFMEEYPHAQARRLWESRPTRTWRQFNPYSHKEHP